VSGLKIKSVPAVERALQIIERLAASRRGLTLSEIARELSFPKSSALGLLVTLERHGYLKRADKGGRYMCGTKLIEVAHAAVTRLEIRQLASPYFRELIKKTNLTVNMAILEQDEVVFVEKIVPPGALSSTPTWVGKHMDVNTTAVGKSLIAYLPDDQLDRFINHLPKHNKNALNSPSRLKEELAKVRKLGYSVNDEENEIGYRAIAVPIFNSDQKVVAAISIAGTTSQISSTNHTGLTRQLKKTGAAISQKLGYSPQISRQEPNR
jgi:DNA-binding IclR family transcriptional regulator